MTKGATRRQVLCSGGTLGILAALAGCSGGSGDSPAGETSEKASSESVLSVAKFVFCDEQPAGYDQYSRRQGKTYRVDETIWVYLDVLNVGSESVGEDQVAINLDESITVTGPSGEPVIEDRIKFDNQFAADIDLQTFFIVNDLHLPSGASAGDYQVEVTLDDGITGESTTVSKTFTAESPG